MSRCGEIPAFDEIVDVAQSLGADSEAPDLWTGAAGLWPFAAGGGLTAFDMSVNRSNGTLTNMLATAWKMTEKGWALDVDGADDFIVLPQLATISRSLPWTVSGWFKAADAGNRRVLFFSGVNGDYSLEIGTRDNEFRAALYDWSGGAAYDWSVSTAFTDTASWHHYAVTSTGILYLDTVPAAGANALGAHNFTAYLIGTGCRAGVADDYRWFGLLTNVVHESRIIPPSEIQQLADPVACWDMYRLRPLVLPAAVAPPTGGPFPHYTRRLMHGGMIGMGG